MWPERHWLGVRNRSMPRGGFHTVGSSGDRRSPRRKRRRSRRKRAPPRSRKAESTSATSWSAWRARSAQERRAKRPRPKGGHTGPSMKEMVSRSRRSFRRDRMSWKGFRRSARVRGLRKGIRTDPATRPSSDPETTARFRTVRVTVGDTVLYDATKRAGRGGGIDAGQYDSAASERRGGPDRALADAARGHGSCVDSAKAAGWQRAACDRDGSRGIGPRGACANAAHYGDGGAGRVRISGATAVDAAGKRCELAMRIDGGRIVYELPSSFLASASLSTGCGPDHLRGVWHGQARLCPRRRTTSRLRRWHGMGTTSWSCGSAESYRPVRDIYGARVSPDGAVLDPAGIAICTAANDQRYPSVVWNGSHFLVVWVDLRRGYFDIYGARVNSDGAGCLILTGLPSVTPHAVTLNRRWHGMGATSWSCGRTTAMDCGTSMEHG